MKVIIILVMIFLISGCAAPTVIMHSAPKGDFVADTRDPAVVCPELQEQYELQECTITEAKSSQDPSECVDGMSPAGCFACTFKC